MGVLEEQDSDLRAVDDMNYEHKIFAMWNERVRKEL